MTYVPDTPVQGQLYHRLTTVIAANHSGLGPQNVSTTHYRPMVGQAFQIPPSSSTTVAADVGMRNPHR